MWDLNSKQAKEFTIKYLNDFMVNKGFILKKTQNTDIHYIRKVESGFDALYLGYLDSFPGKEMEYMLVKRINKVELILDDILKTVEPNRKGGKNDTTFGTNYAKVNSIKHNRYMPLMVNELDVKKSCDLLIHFLENIGLPYIDRFADIKELDKEINGVNYWTDDDLMPFDTRGNFTLKRIIIAKLTNNPLVEDFIKYHLEQIMKGIKKGDYLAQRKEWLKLFEYSVEYLRKI